VGRIRAEERGDKKGGGRREGRGREGRERRAHFSHQPTLDLPSHLECEPSKDFLSGDGIDDLGVEEEPILRRGEEEGKWVESELKEAVGRFPSLLHSRSIGLVTKDWAYHIEDHIVNFGRRHD